MLLYVNLINGTKLQYRKAEKLIKINEYFN